MKQAFHFIVCMSVILFAVSKTWAEDNTVPDRIFDLETSISVGLQNSNELLYIKQEITLNTNRVKEAKSFVYPRLELNSNINKFTVHDLYALPSDLGATVLQPTGVRGDNYYANRLTLKKGIYAGGKSVSTMHLAEASLERAKSQYQVVKNNVIFDIQRSFYQYLLSREKERIYSTVFKTFEHARAAEKKKDMSILRQVRLQGALAEVSDTIAELSRATERAQAEFIKALNIEQDTRISIKGELAIKPAETIALNKYLTWGDQYRPELQQTQFQEKIDALTVNLSMAERYPSLMFGASYEVNGYEFPLDNENWNATLSLNFPLFDGWAGWARVRQKRALREQGRYKKAQLKDEVHLEVRQAFADVEYWRQEITPREERFRTCADLSDRLKRDYEKGGIASDELLEALIIIADIETRYYEAVTAHIVSYASLEKATGKALNSK